VPDIVLDLRYLRYAMLVAEQGRFGRVAALLDVSSSFTRLKGWSLPTSRARATAGHESTASNSRFKLGKDPSGSSASFLTREARSSQPQAEMGSLATTTSRSLGALSCGS